jgi:hypothetical protein
LLDYAGNRGRNFGVDLVGGDLNQWLVDSDCVTDFLQPSGDGSFGYRFSKRWKNNFAHDLVPLLLGVCV